jgi:hypothetical protein
MYGQVPAGYSARNVAPNKNAASSVADVSLTLTSQQQESTADVRPSGVAFLRPARKVYHDGPGVLDGSCVRHSPEEDEC